MRLRFSIRQLALAVLAVGFLVGVAELVHRAWKPKPPLPLPWFSDGIILHNAVTWVNMEDVRLGIKPARRKSVFLDGRVENAGGVALPSEVEARLLAEYADRLAGRRDPQQHYYDYGE